MDRDLAPIVICHSGQSACDHPTTIKWEGKQLTVTKIIKEWREPGSKHYLVEAADNRHFKLTFMETNGRWLVSEVSTTFH